MNPLLAQFLAESADLLSQVDEGLLALERDPADAERVNEVFRAAHTFKGSSGLFDFPELTRLTHAAEDLLDAVRDGRLALDSAMTDDLLTAFDLIKAWLAHVTVHERLPATASADATGLVARLREPLGGEVAGPGATALVAPPADVAPGWLTLFGPDMLDESATWLETTSSTLRFLRYTPDADCFFRGEDPLHLIRQVPALDRLILVEPDAWPAPDDYDEYACLLGFAVCTRAAKGELNHLFRYVTDQVEIVELDGAAIRRLLTGGPEPEAAPGAVPVPVAPPEISAEAGELLRAARRALEVDVPATGNRLAAVVRSVSAAAHALGVEAVLDPADATSIGTVVERLLDGLDVAATTVASPVAPVRGADVTDDGLDRGRADDLHIGGRTLKVDQEKVDHLMELVGELNVAKNGLTFLAAAAEEEFGSRVLGRRIKDQYAGMHRIAEELQAAVMDIRMLPLSVSFARFPRMVRDLGRRLGKEIDLVLEGEETMADKDVIEALGDPLVHLVRNSLDHGIEPASERASAGKIPTATLKLAAVADGDAVVVEVSDDGRGVDPERVKRKAYEKGLISEEQLESLGDDEAVDLLFLPGFSTADQISDLSGRGVGMDAVRASVEKLGGSVTMRSQYGVGTATRLRMPLSMAVTQVMLVSVAGQRFGIPVDQVVETVRVRRDEVNRVLHQDVVILRGEVLPVIDLAEALRMPDDRAPDADLDILVVAVHGQRVGLLVQCFHREVDVILKPMEGLLAGAADFSGTALLGDGLVLLVLNLKEVLGRATVPA